MVWVGEEEAVSVEEEVWVRKGGEQAEAEKDDVMMMAGDQMEVGLLCLES